MTYQKNSDGFTPIDILLVIIGIGIVAALAFVAYKGSITKANKTVYQAKVKQVKPQPQAQNTIARNNVDHVLAQQVLNEVSAKLMQYYVVNNSYPAVNSKATTISCNNKPVVTAISTLYADYLIDRNGGSYNDSLCRTFNDSKGYTYSVSPIGCGDIINQSGAGTTGRVACTSFTLTATTKASPNGAIVEQSPANM